MTKIRNIKFYIFLVLFAISLASIIYWREDGARQEVAFWHVGIWQVCIWIPWVFGYHFFGWVIKSTQHFKPKKIVLLGSCIIWTGVHFVYFFEISSNFSPYLELTATRYGVYPYFFIFWTLIDIGLILHILNDFKQHEPKLSIRTTLYLN